MTYLVYWGEPISGDGSGAGSQLLSDYVYCYGDAEDTWLHLPDKYPISNCNLDKMTFVRRAGWSRAVLGGSDMQLRLNMTAESQSGRARSGL